MYIKIQLVLLAAQSIA